MAMDFAVTSPLQLSQVEDSAASRLAAATAYESHKYSDRDTADACRVQGSRLIPMVVESLGGWGREAQKALKVLGRALASHNGTSHGAATAQLYENLGVKIMRAAARSTLARASDASAAVMCPALARAQMEVHCDES